MCIIYREWLPFIRIADFFIRLFVFEYGFKNKWNPKYSTIQIGVMSCFAHSSKAIVVRIGNTSAESTAHQSQESKKKIIARNFNVLREAVFNVQCLK